VVLVFLAVSLFPAIATAQDEFETTELRSAEEYQQIIANTEIMVGNGQHYEALLKVIDILETGDSNEPYYQDAEFLAGVVLFHLKLYQSSWTYFEKVLDAEPKSARYPDALPWLVALHQQIPGETATLERMAEYEESNYPADMKNEIYFYVGQFHYYQDTLKSALRSLSKVDSSSEDYFLRAKYLEGVVHVRKNNAKAASDSFKAILRYEREKGLNTPTEEKIYRMGMLALARIFYTLGQYKQENYTTSIRYYGQIPEYSVDWLDSLLEVSWAYFQTENYGRALGNLHTLNSPYFEDEYFPEARVLEAVILYSNCHFESALSSIKAFIKSYHPLFKELDNQLKVPRDSNQFYGWLARLSRGNADMSKRLRRIFNAALTDRKLNRSFRFILALSREIERLKKLSQNAPMTEFAATLINELDAFRALQIGETGALARSRLENVRKDLRRLLADSLKVRYETLKKQKKAIEADTDAQLDVLGGTDDYSVDEEHQYWPFRQEYWKDELDSYTVGIRSKCPAKKAPAK
jgi:hypothetical protein